MHIVIYGRVQGVFFRQSTYELAQQIRLTGYVRNKINGTVEAVFEGPEVQIKKMLDWCHKGPAHASVQGIEIVSKESIETNLYETFSIKSTT